MKKLCYFVNSDWYFSLHWTERAVAARNAGYDIHIISHFIDKKITQKFTALGFHCHNISLEAQSFNPLIFIRAFLDAGKILRTIKPDLLHCITIKPGLIGGIHARIIHCPVIISFAGLGRVFSSGSVLITLLRRLTLHALKYISGNRYSVFMFESEKDRRKISALTGIDDRQTTVIDGAGINTDIFEYSKEPDSHIPVVLFAGRMLWSKGPAELIEAGKILRRKNIRFILNMAGILVEKDRDAIPLKEILKWRDEGVINWLGSSSGVHELIKASSLVVLPSVYPEGIPRILLEASSCGRACISYDTGGCAGLITDNHNGLIVRSNTVQELAEKMEYLLKRPQLRAEMGLNGRKRVMEQFSSDIIINKTLMLYKSMTPD
ncbi:glycosyltransferase family 1 protein [Salmonella enterica subsp. enterica serovar Oranienburg]|nr:glycosyltransferase family 1 protein [Salmonella enterica subsp. enterica serovar Oranienburg]HAK8204815.1 glycosyltransferase family 4 protein [Salmonella enterica]